MSHGQTTAEGRRRTKLVLTRNPGQAILIGDAIVYFDKRGKVVIHAPETTKILRAELVEGLDLTVYAESLTGPFVVEGTRHKCQELSDAAQVAELAHRDGKPVTVRNKYGETVYVSKGGE